MLYVLFCLHLLFAFLLIRERGITTTYLASSPAPTEQIVFQKYSAQLGKYNVVLYTMLNMRSLPSSTRLLRLACIQRSRLHSPLISTFYTPTSLSPANKPPIHRHASISVNNDPEDPNFISVSRTDPPLAVATKRRVLGSPTLRLEAVALPQSTETIISTALQSSSLTPRTLRNLINPVADVRAPDTHNEKLKPRRGQPMVQTPPEYTRDRTLAYTAIRFPGTYAAVTHALAELRRSTPSFVPCSLLDFGSGPGTATLAAARVFGSPAFARHALLPHQNDNEDDNPRAPFNDVCLVDSSSAMRQFSQSMLNADPLLRDGLNLTVVPTLKDARFHRHDLVVATYSLSEVVRATMAANCGEPTSRMNRENLAEARLRKLVRSLWRRVAPGGILLVVEDGTAAGFEAVLFVREMLLAGDESGQTQGHDLTDGASDKDADIAVEMPDTMVDTEAEAGKTQSDMARVIVPCLHSKSCPLQGNVTRHRVCRFVQRLNRPYFQRTADPRHDGFEDEYFSYIALQRVVCNGTETTERDERWGRLVRAPLLKGKHVALDACTSSGTLERRIVSKKNAPDGYYHRARKSRWGDIWAKTPTSKPTPVNF